MKHPGVAEYPRLESTPEALTDVLASVCGFRPPEMEATVKVLYPLKRHNWRMDTSDPERPVQVCDASEGSGVIRSTSWVGRPTKSWPASATPPARKPAGPPACGQDGPTSRVRESVPQRYPRRERLRVFAVRVVVVPPLVRRGLWVALGRVLPLLLAPERGDVEIAPGGA
jgi:hypothetical protein